MSLRFVDLFAGLGGFHYALARMGHSCVFASEIDDELRGLYRANFPEVSRAVHGDIRQTKRLVPAHDILCAGFPCQPFSKSGFQLGVMDRTRGTLFHEILEILARHRPAFVILENVGNFERHDGGRTWAVVQESLDSLGYAFSATEHVRTGGVGLVSPHYFGYPHVRERFFVLARLRSLGAPSLSFTRRSVVTSMRDILQDEAEIPLAEREESKLSPQQRECINHWNEFLRRVPKTVKLPSFPIWGDELGASYPYEHYAPYAAPVSELARATGTSRRSSVDDMLARLPSYARERVSEFPYWKRQFIRQNREWLAEIRPHLGGDWERRLQAFPPSMRKFEWNCQGERRDLWRHVLQFRPSGLRAKRFNRSPALVAMTTTQIPIVGPRRRFLTRVEGLRLFGLPDDHLLPVTRAAAFQALGNAVHTGVVRALADDLLNTASTPVGQQTRLALELVV